MLTLMAAFAESESEAMPENVKWGKRRRYICFLIDENGERLVLVPYPNKDFHSHRVPSSVYDGSRSMEICSLKLCRILAARYKWNLNRSYRVPGCIVPKQKAVLRIRCQPGYTIRSRNSLRSCSVGSIQ